MSTESYQTTTAHFINKDWELKSVVLQTLKTEGTHTGEAIADHLEQMRKKWMPLVVPTAVTDNAANEKKAFDILKWHRFGCYGHRINLTVKKALQVNEVSRIVGKGRKLVTLFHQSSSLSDLLKAKQSLVLQGESIHHKLIQDVPTRWNSTYLMLSRLLEQMPAIMAVATDATVNKAAATTLRNCTFSFDEQFTVERCVDILEPLYRATTILCADQIPTLQKILPVLVKLKRITQPNEGDSTVVQKMKSIILDEIENREKPEDEELVLLAVILNPFTKHMDFLSETQREKANTLLLTKVGEIVGTPATPPIAIVKTEPTDEPQAPQPHLSKN